MDSNNSNQKVSVKDMTNEQLLEARKRGVDWMDEQEQVTGTELNKLGKPYSHLSFMAGLHRMEEIEDELLSRGVEI